MRDLFFLVLDVEGRALFDKFKKLHPDGSHLVFKLLLKSYVKYADWHKKKGRNPIISFEDLVNRETGEKQDSTDDGRIRYLNEIIEKYEGEKNLSADELSKEIGELKSLILSIAQSNRTHSPQETLKDFKPKDGAALTKVEGPKPKKRLNYRDVRGKAGVKKIEF